MATSIRVSEATRAHAAELATRTGSSIGEVVDRALVAYDAARFWHDARSALATYHESLDPDPAWDTALRDDLDRD